MGPSASEEESRLDKSSSSRSEDSSCLDKIERDVSMKYECASLLGDYAEVKVGKTSRIVIQSKTSQWLVRTQLPHFAPERQPQIKQHSWYLQRIRLQDLSSSPILQLCCF